MLTMRTRKRSTEGHDMEKSEFGDRMRELREAAGLTQAALAEKLGVPQSAISQWEGGRHAPPVTSVPDLAKALGVEAGELFKPATKAKPVKRDPPPKRRG